MQPHDSQTRSVQLIDSLRLKIADPDFTAAHRRIPTHFTRERLLPFSRIVLLITQKTLKSVQLHLNEWFSHLDFQTPPTASAFCHARQKLLPSAFWALNSVVLHTVYDRPQHASLISRWRGHRLLAIDSTLIRLPDTPEARERYHLVQCRNGKGYQGSYVEARLSVLYDLANQMALDTALVSSEQGERQLASTHLRLQAAEGDLVVFDRGYEGYLLMAQMLAQKVHFLIRGSRGSFGALQALFQEDKAGVSQRVRLPVPDEARAICLEKGWPLEVTARLITVRLSTGELEVLVTSLLDEDLYPTKEFSLLYWKRWGQETFFGRIKGRLDLENFSGKSPNVVEQDIAALIFLSNMETVLLSRGQQRLQEHTNHRRAKVKLNRAVSLHAVKMHLFELLARPCSADQILEKLSRLFLTNPITIRHNRVVPRMKTHQLARVHFLKRVRKIVY